MSTTNKENETDPKSYRWFLAVVLLCALFWSGALFSLYKNVQYRDKITQLRNEIHNLKHSK